MGARVWRWSALDPSREFQIGEIERSRVSDRRDREIESFRSGVLRSRVSDREIEEAFEF
jgi:hypothetical protein